MTNCISQPSKSLKDQKLANVKIVVNNLTGSGQISFKASKEMLECTDKVNCTVYDYELPWTSLKTGENSIPLFPKDKYYSLLQFDYKEYVPYQFTSSGITIYFGYYFDYTPDYVVKYENNDDKCKFFTVHSHSALSRERELITCPKLDLTGEQPIIIDLEPEKKVSGGLTMQMWFGSGPLAPLFIAVFGPVGYSKGVELKYR